MPDVGGAQREKATTAVEEKEGISRNLISIADKASIALMSQFSR